MPYYRILKTVLVWKSELTAKKSLFHPLGFDAALLPQGEATSVLLRFFPPMARGVGGR